MSELFYDLLSLVDIGVAESIEANLKPQQTYNFEEQFVLSHPLCSAVTESVAEAYFARLSSQALYREANQQSRKVVTYTGNSHLFCLSSI